MINYTVSMSEMLENSYRNFHVKGFDYICLSREPSRTEKLYMFDGNFNNFGEVVNPHDHRYDFHTSVVYGRMQNMFYEPVGVRDKHGQIMHRYEYSTPLLGGDGFKLMGTSRLFETDRNTYGKGQFYSCNAEQIHTIRMLEDQTCLRLVQYGDVIPENQSTQTFSLSNELTLDDGLYERWTADELRDRLQRLSGVSDMAFNLKD